MRISRRFIQGPSPGERALGLGRCAVLDAVVFVPYEDPAHERWVHVCCEHCAEHNYRVVAVAGTYADAIAMLFEHGSNVMVVARWDHLPPDRLPRIEIVADIACADVHATTAPPPQRTIQTDYATQRPERARRAEADLRRPIRKSAGRLPPA